MVVKSRQCQEAWFAGRIGSKCILEKSLTFSYAGGWSRRLVESFSLRAVYGTDSLCRRSRGKQDASRSQVVARDTGQHCCCTGSCTCMGYSWVHASGTHAVLSYCLVLWEFSGRNLGVLSSRLHGGQHMKAQGSTKLSPT